jgi:hypothetical protein
MTMQILRHSKSAITMEIHTEVPPSVGCTDLGDMAFLLERHIDSS